MPQSIGQVEGVVAIYNSSLQIKTKPKCDYNTFENFKLVPELEIRKASFVGRSGAYWCLFRVSDFQPGLVLSSAKQS